MKSNCPFCAHILKAEGPYYGHQRVIGACRPCAECGVIKYPVYNFLQCAVCKQSGVYGIHWLHEYFIPHVSCYNSINSMIAAGLLESVAPFKVIRKIRQWD
jgi:hypothetical protein